MDGLKTVALLEVSGQEPRYVEMSPGILPQFRAMITAKATGGPVSWWADNGMAWGIAGIRATQEWSRGR